MMFTQETVRNIMNALSQLGVRECRECGSETLNAFRAPAFVATGGWPDKQTENDEKVGYTMLFCLKCMQCTNVRLFEVEDLLSSNELVVEQ